MKALLRAELMKARGTRITGLLVLLTLTLVVLTAINNVPEHPSDPDLFAGTIGISFAVPNVVAALMGAMASTEEFRYGTIVFTYLGEPRRSRVLAAKCTASAVSAVGLALVSLAVAVPVGIAAFRSRGIDLHVGGQLWQTVVLGIAIMMAYAVAGVALGALIRNQVVAVVGILAWMLMIERVVLPSWPIVGRWLPLGTVSAVMQLGPEVGEPADLLPWTLAAALFVTYVGVLVAAAVWVAPRRDVY